MRNGLELSIVKYNIHLIIAILYSLLMVDLLSRSPDLNRFNGKIQTIGPFRVSRSLGHG